MGREREREREMREREREREKSRVRKCVIRARGITPKIAGE